MSNAPHAQCLSRRDLPSRRFFVSLVGLSVAIACGTADETGAPSAADCTRLRDHVIELRLADASGVDRAAHRDAMERALGASFVDSCTSKLSAREVRCARTAQDAESLRACSAEVSR